VTAPGSGTATSGGECTKETPCFVCEVKGVVASAGVSATFSDAPFAINIVGCRGINTISNRFDDRLIAFMALPADEAGKALDDAKMEADLVTAVADAAGKLNGAKPTMRGRGVRRVACSSIEIEAGKPTAGHRVVAMFPITTDPGLVRLKKGYDEQKAKFEEELKTREAQLKTLEDGKKSFDDLTAKFKEKGDAVKALPKPAKKGDPKSPELVQAEAELKAVQDAIDALAASLGWKKSLLTAKTFDDRIQSAKTARDTAKQQLDDYTSGKLTAKEEDKFEGYHYAFQREDGTWEGDNHAFFPTGHHANKYSMGLHHGSSDNAAPALTVGIFLGERIVSGRGVKRYFAEIQSFPRESRVGAVPSNKAELKKQKDANTAELKKFDADKKEALKKFDADNKTNPNARTDRAALEAKLATDRQALEATLAKKVADIEAARERLLLEASREHVVVTAVRKAAGPTPPVGTWIVMACQVGSALLADDDVFELEGHAGRMSGREVRLHYFGLAGDKAREGLKIHAHSPAGGRPALPAGTAITAKEAMFEHNHTLVPIRDDDVFEVEGRIGGTNIHRGHNMSADESGAVSFSAESLENVGNWSTGCQVVALSPEFNLFIRLASLSKRWRCLHDATVPACAPTKDGSATAPDSQVWKHLVTKVSFPPKAVSEQIAADTKKIQGEIATAQAAVDPKVDAWFKARKTVKRPKNKDEAEKLMADTLDQEIADLTAKHDAAAAANTPFDDAPRQALITERQDLATTAGPRDAARHRADMLAVVQKRLRPGEIRVHTEGDKDEEKKNKASSIAAMTFVDAETAMKQVSRDLDAHAAQVTDAPEAKANAEAASKAAAETITALKKTCYQRAVKMKHDCMRTCDIEGTCAKRYAYTLIEIPPTDSNGKILSLAKLDDDFAKKAGTSDVNPLWSGFRAQ
jgi:hypothetical protein